MTTIGFTGTRDGMTQPQRDTVFKMLQGDRSVTKAVHGDCIGADEEFNEICVELEIPVFCRPCNMPQFRAFTDAQELAGPKPPMVRNADIVADANVMIATPKNRDWRKERRGGTVNTIRIAKRANKRCIVVEPDGSSFVE